MTLLIACDCALTAGNETSITVLSGLDSIIYHHDIAGILLTMASQNRQMENDVAEYECSCGSNCFQQLMTTFYIAGECSSMYIYCDQTLLYGEYHTVYNIKSHTYKYNHNITFNPLSECLSRCVSKCLHPHSMW